MFDFLTFLFTFLGDLLMLWWPVIVVLVIVWGVTRFTSTAR
jgi:hypothetical protein